jgi:hypothetical protein
VLLFATPTSARAATADTGPTSQIWYFAEGRVGGGFVQWLTVSNPNALSCTVTIQYYYKRDYDTANSQKKVTFTVEKNTRHTQYVNNDLGIKQFDMNGAVLSASVSTSDCPGIVAERPMYFSNFHGVSSGTDVFGADQLKTEYYFAEVPTGSAGESFISIFNPNSQDVPVETSYYSNGQIVTQTHTVKANSRDTFEPNGAGLTSPHVAVRVRSLSTLGIVAERPSYYINVDGSNGSADVMGADTSASHWTFAAGETTGASREVLTLANFSETDVATVSIKLLSSTGTTTTPLSVTIPAKSTMQVDINGANQFVNHTEGVALDVQTDAKTPIVAQREIFQTYDSGANWTAQGVSDSLGVHNDYHIYNFAEGFTSVNFAEDLALANTSTANDQQITITLSNMLGQTDTKTVTVGKGSQQVVSITSMVKNSTVFTLSDVKAYAVSMSVQSVDKTPFAAERVMHWHAFGTQGVSTVPGYASTSTIEVTPT